MKYLYLSLLLIAASFCQSASARSYQAVSFTHEGLSVDARLTLPAGPAPYRVIVIAPGSGANDKDGTLTLTGANASCLFPGLYGNTIRPYKGLSDALADSGFAVLTYDKVEYTYSSGLGTITFSKLWLPVVSGLAYLKTRTDIDTTNIVLLGHSEGSTLIPYIARSQPGVKALISLAGARRSVYDTLLAFQLYNIAKTCGGDTNMAKAQGAQLISYFSAIRSGTWNSSTPPFAGVSAAVWSDYIKVSDSVVINYNMAARPTLFIGLGDDINVPVSTELNAFRQEIKVPADFYEISGLNHYLTTATDPATSEVLTDTIVYWLRRHLAATSVTTLQTPGESAFSLSGSNADWQVMAKGETLQLVEVYDMAGRLVSKTALYGHTSVAHFGIPRSAGLYIVRITGSRSAGSFKISHGN